VNKAPEIIERATGHKSIEDSKTDVKFNPSAVMRLVGNKRDKPGAKTAESRACA
jgi:hypothetical protein